jgi:MYXO-CTERM domain-containing protein
MAPILLIAGTASADVPNDPCMGLSAGAPCTTLSGSDGTCQDGSGFLECTEGGGTGGSTGTTGGSTPTGGGSTGDGGTDGGGSSSDDGGCAVSNVGRDAGVGALGLLALVGLGLSRRRRG